MGQITGALVGIAMVLSAVFVPVAFFPGSTGVIYRQFAVTIVSAMALSVVVALTLTPALCATLLRPPRTRRGPAARFNSGFAALTRGYAASVGWLVRRPVRVGLVWLALAAGAGVLGGTLSATVLGVLFVPLFYVVVRRLVPLRARPGSPAGAPAE